MMVNKRLFSSIESKLLTEEFVSSFRKDVKSGKLKLYKRNPELIKLVSKYTGISEEELKPVWSDVYRLLLDIYYNRRKVKKRKKLEGGLGLNTLANSLFFSLYNKYEHKTPEIMYTLLEPYMTAALSGDRDAVEKARLLYLPISMHNLDGVLGLLTEIISSNREIFCDDMVISGLDIVCTQTNNLPSSRSSSSKTKDTEYCLSRLRRIVSEVCTHD